MDKEEFCQRFVVKMVSLFPNGAMADGESIKDYAEAVAPSYYDDVGLRDDGPETCAESEASEFGDE